MLYINISEIIRLKNRLKDIKLSIKNTLNGVSQELTDVNYNIRSSELIRSNENIATKISELSTNVDQYLNLLLNFMESQTESYQLANDEAKNSLEELVGQINSTFDSNGNVIAKASAFAASSPLLNSYYDASGVDISVYTNKPEKGFTVTTGNATYDLSDNDRDLIYGIVAAESDKSYDDALAVASVILNRCEAPNWVASYGTNPVAQATAKNQFVVYQEGYYKQYTNGAAPDTVRRAVDDALNGVRNCDYMSFRSSGSTSYSDNRITDSGNRYK